MSRVCMLDPGIDLAGLEGSGVLVGSYLPSHLLGVYVAPTPVDAEEGEEGDGAKEGELDVPWMLEHAKQVLRMLPGGVHVVGFVINSGQDLLTKSESKIKKLLSGLRSLDPAIDEAVFLVSQGLKGRSLQTDQLKSVEAKVSEDSIEFVELDTQVILDIPVAFKCGLDSNKMLLSHAQKALEKFERTINSSVCLFNSKLRSKDDIISPPQFDTKRKGKGKQKDRDVEEDGDEAGKLKYSVIVLLKDEPNVSDDVLIEENNIRIKLTGKLRSRTYVPHGTSIELCRKAVVEDITRSLRGRVQLHCDSLVGEENEVGETDDGPIVHEPPRRVFTLLPGTQICISDYLYPGEGGEDSIESIKEIFGFSPTEEDIEDDLEIVAAAKDVRRELDSKSTATKSPMNLGYIVASLGVAALSLGMAWYRFRSAAGRDEDEGHEEL